MGRCRICRRRAYGYLLGCLRAAMAAKPGLLQKTMGHASITVTAHIYADLNELDDIASALDTLDDLPTNRA